MEEVHFVSSLFDPKLGSLKIKWLFLLLFCCSLSLYRLLTLYVLFSLLQTLKHSTKYYLDVNKIILRHFHQFLTAQEGKGSKTTIFGSTGAWNLLWSFSIFVVTFLNLPLFRCFLWSAGYIYRSKIEI